MAGKSTRASLRGRASFAPFLCCLIGMLPAGPASAEEALVAVAANFQEVAEKLEVEFEAATDHDLTITTGSTGKLYAQIKNGAPYDILLAADQRRPELLEREGDAVSGSRFTYAVGRLALWSADPARVAADGSETLRAGAFRKLAMANPDLAPYGEAAMQTLAALGLLETLEKKIVMGENVGQAHALVATGNAELGFVALSYVLSPRNEKPGSHWAVPQELYQPIRQDAVLLVRAVDNVAARAFLEYLKSDAARSVIERFGYGGR
jgi:molybdate transport system substrate-binding protein